MLTRIWLTPPLAIARVGGSPTPSDAFTWSHSDLTPDGSGRTTLARAETINLEPNGVPSRVTGDRIVFRDAQGIRPVCPYFELNGSWRERGRTVSGPLTTAALDKLGIRLRDISWSVHCTQLKAFHYTYDNDDRIDAVLQLRGDDTARHTIEGRSPARAKQPLVPKGKFVPLGQLQIARPSLDYPEIRLRFYAPPGHTYGPTNIDQRIKRANRKLPDNAEWRSLKLPPDRKILNPKSSWATYVLETATLGPFHGTDARNFPQPFRDTDARNYPNFLFAFLLVGADENDAEHHALGLVDDISDGVISCAVKSKGKTLTAIARIVVGPPDFGPASRPPISLADNLADRTKRADARKTSAWHKDDLRDIVHDIFERAFETSDLINKDYQNWRCRAENIDTLNGFGKTSPYDREQVDAMLWADINDDIAAIQTGKSSPSRLSEGGERKHRRYAAVEYLEMRFRENPELFDAWIRRPLDPNPYFDTRMPALMRGSDSRPWHLTRRQWELVRMWKDRLEAERPQIYQGFDACQIRQAGRGGQTEAMTVRDATSELRIIDSALGRHLFVVDGSRIYDLPDGADLDGLALDDLMPEDRRRIDDTPLQPPPLQSLSLNLAQACNMGCSYCYADAGKFGGRARMMSLEVAQTAVDRLIAEAAPGADLLVGFMGGEPFLHRALMRDVVPYACAQARRSGRTVRFSVTTNATVLTEDDVRFLADHDFQVAVSIDGPKALNDAQRPLNGGGSAYERVVAALGLFDRLGRPRHLSARATVAPGGGSLLPVLDHLVALGFDSIGFSPILVSPDPRRAFTAADFDRFTGDMIACGTKSKQALLARERYPFSNFETALHEIHRGSHRPYPCGAGAAYLSVDADGALYACHRLVDDERFAMGDVRSGSDLARRAAHLAERHVHRQEPCRSCWARYLCGGGCYHEVERRGRVACDYIRAWLTFCIASYAEISAQAPDYFAAPERYYAPKHAPKSAPKRRRAVPAEAAP